MNSRFEEIRIILESASRVGTVCLQKKKIRAIFGLSGKLKRPNIFEFWRVLIQNLLAVGHERTKEEDGA